MNRRNKPEGAIRTDGWMMSYADMATILLAVFIVLSALGKDQTGVSLQKGTGSFARSLQPFELSGLFSASSAPLPTSGPMPAYLYVPATGTTDKTGPEGGAPPPVLDEDEEHLARFLAELRRQFPCERLPRQAGQVVIDLNEPLQKAPPYLTAGHNEVLRQVLPLLERSNYRLHLIVWATTPAPPAWAQAANSANLAVRELAATAELPETIRPRLVPQGQPWLYRDVRRPALSFVLVKLE